MPVTRDRMPLVVGVLGVVAFVVAVVLMDSPVPPAPLGTPGSGSGSARRAPTATVPPVLPDGALAQQLIGVVVDASGTPVAGVEIVAELEETATPSAGTTIVEGTTGADGRFVIALADVGRYRLRVTGPGLVPAQLRFVAVPADEIRVVVARQVRVDGMVLDGKLPVAGATVGLRGEVIGGAIQTITDHAGAFHFPDLPEGRYQVYAWKEHLVVRTVAVPRIGAGPFLPLELRAETGTILVGRVVDRDEGTGLAAAIELRAETEGEAPRYARSGDDGVFRIEGVPTGTWIADAFAPGFISPGGIELAAGVGIPELALVRGATIEGRVIDGSGNPLAGVAVRALASGVEYSLAVERDQLRRFSGVIAAPMVTTGFAGADPQLLPRGELGVLLGPIPPIPPPGAVVAMPAALDPTLVALAPEPAPLPVAASRASIWTSGTDGRFRISGLAKGKVAGLALIPGLAEGRSRLVEVALGDVVIDVDIMITAGTMITGTVTDHHGVPVRGAIVRATPEVGAPLDAFADAFGEYKLGPLIGEVELVASARGHTSVRTELVLEPTRGITPGTHVHKFTLVVADAVFAGTIDDAAGAIVDAATLEIIEGPAAGRRAVAGSDGTFVIDMLPPGPLRVRVSHPDYPSVELEGEAAARGTATARLRMPLGGAVEGVVLDATTGSPLPGVELHAESPSGTVATTRTDPQGRFHLGPLVPGSWRITVKQSGYVPAAREVEVSAAREPGGVSVRDVRIDIERGGLLAGTVRDVRGTRIAGVTITVRSNGSGAAATAVTSSQGEFRIKDCPTGTLDVSAKKGDFYDATTLTLRPGTELLTLELTIR